MTELEELKEKIDEQIKKQKDYSLAFTVLDSQLAQANNLLAQGQNAISDLNKTRDNLEAVVNSEKAELIRKIDQKEFEVSRRETAAQEFEGALRGQRNSFSIELDNFHKGQEECNQLKVDLNSKIEKIADFLNHAKEMLETFK